LRTISNLVSEPVRESLKTWLSGWEGGIDKDEFIEAFGEQGIGKFDLVCLFYHFDVEDTMDDIVHLETMVKLISTMKGVPYKKEVA
jgi:hypothetical protein